MGNRGKVIGFVLSVVGLPSVLIAQESIEGWLYSRAGVAVYRSDDAAPAPEPQPSGKCETCNGTGRVGDGRVSVVCMDCGGDGVRGNANSCNCGEQCNCGPDCQCVDCECCTVVEKPEPLKMVQAVVSYRQICGPGGCSVEPVYDWVPVADAGDAVCSDGNCASGSCGTVGSGPAQSGSAGGCSDGSCGPVRRVVGRIRENKPVRSFIGRVFRRR